MTERKGIQRERVKRYFLEAAKEIVETEGLAALTTKKIGERAGFSYATIYNYFSNFNELACLAVEELTADISRGIVEEWGGDSGSDADVGPRDASLPRAFMASPMERVLAFKDLMVDRFAGKPNRYFPFLSTEIDFSYFTSRDGHPYVHPAWTALHGELSARSAELGLDPAGIKQFADILSYVFHAKLHFYIRYGVPSSIETLKAELDSEIRFLFGTRFDAPLTPT